MKETIQPGPGELEGYLMIEQRRDPRGLKEPNPMLSFVITQTARRAFNQYAKEEGLEWVGVFSVDDPFFQEYLQEKGLTDLAAGAIYRIGWGATEKDIEPKQI